MKHKVDSEIVVAYRNCPRKAYLLLFEQEDGKSHEHINLLAEEKVKN
ncbi:MAG: hypothetical protein F6K42_27595 [Leptolyngbya sp. SIO1D8]|nr:hypothetical protein [Leptolyngbya sp. SIO1D8]